MPAFFVPETDSAEQAEGVYATFVSQANTYPLAHPSARLFSITFMHKGKPVETIVGREMKAWPERAGTVLGIVEMTQLVLVFTVARGALSGTPIYVGPDEVRHRTYFDNYPR